MSEESLILFSAKSSNKFVFEAFLVRTGVGLLLVYFLINLLCFLSKGGEVTNPRPVYPFDMLPLVGYIGEGPVADYT